MNSIILNLNNRKIEISKSLWNEVTKRTPSYDEESLAAEAASKLGRKKGETVSEALSQFTDEEVVEACTSVLLARKRLWE